MVNYKSFYVASVFFSFLNVLKTSNVVKMPFYAYIFFQNL